MKTPIAVVQLCFDFTIVLFFRLKYFQLMLDFLLRSTMNGAYCVNETWTQEFHSSMYLFTAVFFQFCIASFYILNLLVGGFEKLER